MLPLLTVITGPAIRIAGRKDNATDRALKKLTAIVAARINSNHGRDKVCNHKHVGVRLFLVPECPVYLLNLGDLSVSLELDEEDLLSRDATDVQDFAETLAEVIQNDGPFRKSGGTRPITHCHVRCGRFLGRVVLF